MLTRVEYCNGIALLMALILLAACSGVKTYPNTLASNLHVVTNTDTSVDTIVDIYQVNPDCSVQYSGTLQLDRPAVDIGIPAGRSSYLLFTFSSSGFFTGSSSTSYGTMLRPRSDRDKFLVDVSYADNIFNVVIHELRNDSKPGREIEVRDLNSCKPV